MKARSLTFLARQHRRALWTPPLWVGGAGLALALLLRGLQVDAAPLWLALGIVGALAALARVWPRRHVRDTARSLDAKMGAKNRFEALAESIGREDALAAALTADVDRYLTDHTPPRPYAWGGGLVFFLALLIANFFSLISPSPHASPPVPLAAQQGPAAPMVAIAKPETPPPPTAIPPAALRWIAPAEEISATAKEEIPLSAEADSATGLRQFSLHVALNGEARPPIPLLEELGPGAHPVTTSLLLAALEPQPYDVVTYSLSAERVRPGELPSTTTWPPVFAPLQMIQIRAPRDEAVDAVADWDDPTEHTLAEIAQLKREQFGILRDAYFLDRGPAARTEPAWQESIATIAGRQTVIAEKTNTALQSSSTNRLAPETAAALTAAEKEAWSSASALKSSTPENAVTPANRALTALAAAEKSLTQAVRERRARRAAETAERAAREETLPTSDLPARATTPAGRLEKLAFEQYGFAARLASLGGSFAEQDGLSRQISRLAAEKGFSAGIARELGYAAEGAREAAAQLNDQDVAAATEPAMRAAQALKESVATQEAVGRWSATEEILAAQRSLIRTATDLRLAPPAESARVAERAVQKIAALQQGLRASARRQQEQGSADAAKRLNALSNEIAQSRVLQELAQNAKAGSRGGGNPSTAAQNQAAAQKLTQLAQRSATEAANLDDARQIEARALEELRRVQANLNRLTGQGRATGPLRWTSPSPEIHATAAETIPLAAEAVSERALARLALQVAVDGAPRPPVALPDAVSPGSHTLTLSLPLAGYQLKDGQSVTYLLTAQTAGDGPAAPVASPVQLIFIGKKEESAESASKMEPSLQAQLQNLHDEQRDIVGRLLRLTQSEPPRNDRLWLPLVDELQTQEATVTTGLEKILTTSGDALPTRVKERIREARSHAKRAAASLAASDPSAASPPATRALAELAKLFAGLPKDQGMMGDADMADLYEKAVASAQQLGGQGGQEGQTAQGAGGESGNGGQNSAGGAGGQQGGGGERGSKGSQQDKDSDSSSSSSSGGDSSRQASTASGAKDGSAAAISSSNQSRGGGAAGEPEKARPTMSGNAPVNSNANTIQRLGPPPPPGPGRGAQEIKDYAVLLSQRVNGLINLRTDARPTTDRGQVLTIGNPADAPPAYRSAVADYFEALARDRASTAPRKP